VLDKEKYYLYRSQTSGQYGNTPWAIITDFSQDFFIDGKELVVGEVYYYVLRTVDTGGNIGPASAEFFGEVQPDTTPPRFTISYYYDEGFNRVVKMKEKSPLVKKGIVYLKIVANERLASPPLFEINQPGTVDVANQPTTLVDGSECVFRGIYEVRAPQGDEYQDGEAEVRVSGRDKHNNLSEQVLPTEGGNFIIDGTAPQSPTIIQIYPSGKNVEVVFDYSPSEDVVKYYIYRSRETNQNYKLIEIIIPDPNSSGDIWNSGGFKRDYYPDGVYFFKMEAVDLAGNVSVPHEKKGVLDRVPPHFTVEYYRDEALADPFEGGKEEKVIIEAGQRIYLKIIATEPLVGPPSFSLDQPGTEDVKNQATVSVDSGGQVYRGEYFIHPEDDEGRYRDGEAKITITGKDKNGRESKDIPPQGGVFIIKTNLNITIAEKEGMPEELEVYLNYPNPFNPEAYIPFALPEGGSSELVVRIYNILGQLVREMRLGGRDGGYYTHPSRGVYWDGKDSRGLEVPAGVYFCEVAGENVRKMVVVR
jgi:hypothetical protein